MEVIRTVKVKLHVSVEQRDDLHETANQFRFCANQAAAWAWQESTDDCVTNKAQAERALYARLREDTDLHANLVQKGIRRAIEAVKSGVTRRKNGFHTSRPEFNSWSIVYDKRSASFYRDRVSLSTVNRRIECSYILPESPDETPIGDYLLNEDYDFRTSTLQYDRSTDTFYLHATMKRIDRGIGDNLGTHISDAKHRTVLGVDLNVDGYLAVTSTGTFVHSADHINHIRREFEKRRGNLQRTGTRSAHLAIQRIDNREQRRIRDILHNVSNTIVGEAIVHDCTHIAFEDLTGIRNRMIRAKRFHMWTFCQLYEFVAYKAEEQGLVVEQVDPSYTSQRCSYCGHTSNQNRPSKHDFECEDCSYELNADYNAAKNIAHKLADRLRAGQTSSSGGVTSQIALKSGTMMVSGEYRPAQQRDRTEDHRQSHD